MMFWTALFLSTIHFEDVTVSAGIRFENMYGGVRAKRFILETTGTGAAFFDYDEDGDQDLFLVNGTRLGYTELQSRSNALFRNNGDGTFTNVTAAAGLEAYGWGQGAAAADIDHDGDLDLLVTYYGANRFYRNRGDGTFREEAAIAGLDDPGWGTSAAFGDYDADGIPDLFVANYVSFDEQTTPGPGEAPNCFFMGIPVMCGPKGLAPAKSLLYRGHGDGRFERITDTEVGAEAYFSLGAVWGDLDNDGDLDLYVANDQTPNNLFLNDGRGGFADIALEAGVAYNEDGRAQAGMGVDLGDYDNDGLLDIHVTNFSHDYNTLYHNTGDGYFLDDSFQAAIGNESYLYLGWGTGFQDFDKDGFVDLFVTNGHVYPEVDVHATDSTYAQRNLVFHNQGDGTFAEVGASLAIEIVGRGVAFADYDNDGDIDVVVTGMNAAPVLLRNASETSKTANWIGLRLVGRASSRDALGARVTVVTRDSRQIREVRSGGSYLSQSDLRVFFGLGNAESVDRIEIRWPSGGVQTLRAPSIHRYLTVVEPLGGSEQ